MIIPFHACRVIPTNIQEMKRLIMMSVILASSFIYKAADAQVRVNLNINMASQPKWVQSNHAQVNYYYLPDLDMYYNVPERSYTYPQGNRWVTVNALPLKYRNYDFGRGYKVVVNERNPWNNHVQYKNRYAKNKKVIKLKPNEKQYYSKNNSRGAEYERNERNNDRFNDRTVRKGR